MITPEIQKKIRTSWTRKMAKIANLVQTMEAELDRMRSKKVSEDFIQEKSSRIDTMIDALNTADEIITIQRNEIAQLRIELFLVSSQLTKEQELDLIKTPTTDLVKTIHETQKKSDIHR